MVPYPNQWVFWKNVPCVSEEQLDEVIDLNGLAVGQAAAGSRSLGDVRAGLGIAAVRQAHARRRAREAAGGLFPLGLPSAAHRLAAGGAGCADAMAGQEPALPEKACHLRE